MEYYVFIMYIMSAPVINKNALKTQRQIKAAANNGANQTLQSNAPESPENATALGNTVAAETAAEMNNDANQKLQSDALNLQKSAMTLRNEVAADDDVTGADGADNTDAEYSGKPKIDLLHYDSQANLEFGLQQLEFELRIANLQISILNESANSFRNIFNSQFRKKSSRNTELRPWPQARTRTSNGGSKARSFRLLCKRSKKHKYYKRKSTMKQKSKRRRSSRR